MVLMNFKAGRPQKKSASAATGNITTSLDGPGKARSEHVEQREFVSWFRQTYRPVRIFAIPNGEARSRTVGARLKLEGVSPGVPDLFVPEWGLWVEMKRTKGGTISPSQKDWHRYLLSIGQRVIVGHGFEDACRQVQALTGDGSPLRRTS
jgi:hypothetical protein